MKENKTFKLQNSPKGTVQFDPETGLPKDVKQYQEDIKAGVDVSEPMQITTNLRNIGFLRQWLNEDRRCEPMVTNEDIIYWLNLK